MSQDRRYQLLGRRLVCENRRFDVYFDKFESDGDIIPDFLVVKPKVTSTDGYSGICVLPEMAGRVGLMHGYRHHLDSLVWQAPAGFCDPGETAAQSGLDGAFRGRIVAAWIDQTIQLVGCPRHFGGRQWYFKCPRDNRNVAVLWSPPGKRFFAGRKSWGSQFAFLSQFYGPGQRAHYMVNKLCNRLEDPEPYCPWKLPAKPRWMRRKTYERLVDRCERYYDEATTLPIEYRLSGDVV